MTTLNLDVGLDDFRAVLAERDQTIGDGALKIRALMREVDKRDNLIGLLQKENAELKATAAATPEPPAKAKKAK